MAYMPCHIAIWVRFELFNVHICMLTMLTQLKSNPRKHLLNHNLKTGLDQTFYVQMSGFSFRGGGYTVLKRDLPPPPLQMCLTLWFSFFIGPITVHEMHFTSLGKLSKLNKPICFSAQLDFGLDIWTKEFKIKIIPLRTVLNGLKHEKVQYKFPLLWHLLPPDIQNLLSPSKCTKSRAIF